MGRLIDADEIVTNYGDYYAEEGPAEGYIGTVKGLVNAMPTAEAIPVDWIEAEIKKLRDMDNGFAAMTAGQIEAMLKRWREEQKGEQNGQN